MKAKILVTLPIYVFFLFMISGSGAEAAKTATEIIAEAKQSIVRILYEIQPEDKQLLQFYFQRSEKIKEAHRALSGSGFVVRSDGYILTNYHVVRPLDLEPKIFVRIPGEGDFPIKAQKLDRERNLALLVIEKFGLKDLTLGESEIGKVLKEGQDLLAIGYPFAANISQTTDKEPSATKGIISAFKQSHLEATFIQTDAAINAGNSGGPAFNNEGHVIGVVFAGAGDNNNVGRTFAYVFGAKERPPTNISFVIPIDHVKDMLRAANVDWRKPPSVKVGSGPGGTDRVTGWRAWLSSPKFYLPVAGLIVLGVIAAFYIESAQRKKNVSPSDQSRPKQEPSSTQTQPMAGTPSPRTTGYSLGSLKCTGGELAGKTFTVPEKGINIGRGPGSEIQLSSDVVSRRQAWIGPVAGETVIKDLGSTNGTFVNDQQVTESRRLRSGDTVRITKNGHDVFTFTA
jgi:S1-C subfamily serine protease